MLIRSAPLFVTPWFKGSALALVFLLVVLSVGKTVDAAECKLSTRDWQQMHHRNIALIPDDGRLVELRVRIADEPNERSAGFQHICPEIATLNAILFVYKQPEHRGFHMNNVHTDLDIGFFDAEGKLFQIIRMHPAAAPTSQRDSYQADAAFQYALETRADFFVENDLRVGVTRLSFQ